MGVCYDTGTQITLATLERYMQRLYPNWKHGIQKPVRCIYDGSRKCRSPNDLGVKQSLQLLLRWDDFGRHIWDQVRPVATTFGLEIDDVVRFMKTFCLILCYGVSIDRYYKNRRKVRTQLIHSFVLICSSCAILRICVFAKVYKFLDPNDSLSEAKFRAFLNAFKPNGSLTKRAALNAFLASSRKTWGSFFFSNRAWNILH